eukprot:1532258-Pyramimonas_sp.AAC.1
MARTARRNLDDVLSETLVLQHLGGLGAPGCESAVARLYQGSWPWGVRPPRSLRGLLALQRGGHSVIYAGSWPCKRGHIVIYMHGPRPWQRGYSVMLLASRIPTSLPRSPP